MDPFWAIVELMGHRRMAGLVSEVALGGTTMLRCDVFEGDTPEASASPLFQGTSVYCLTPCAEATARQVARSRRVEPVSQWALPAPPARSELDRAIDAEFNDQLDEDEDDEGEDGDCPF